MNGFCARVFHVSGSQLVEKQAKKRAKEVKSGPKVQKEVKKRSKRGPFYYRFFSTGRIKFHFSLLVEYFILRYGPKCIASAVKDILEMRSVME